MFEEENDNKIYRLIITNGYDKNREYAKFTEQIYSKTAFLWKESISGSYSTANKEFFEKIDVIILLAGLYNNNKENFNEKAKNFSYICSICRIYVCCIYYLRTIL